MEGRHVHFYISVKSLHNQPIISSIHIVSSVQYYESDEWHRCVDIWVLNISSYNLFNYTKALKAWLTHSYWDINLAIESHGM